MSWSYIYITKCRQGEAHSSLSLEVFKPLILAVEAHYKPTESRHKHTILKHKTQIVQTETLCPR